MLNKMKSAFGGAKQIVVIHGGNPFYTYKEYLAYLKSKELSLDKFRIPGWKMDLGNKLGKSYDVLNPKMPNAENARYSEWKIWFERLVELFDEEVIFIGHSLGGIFLAKYLSENKYPKKIKATFLVAAPYNTKNEDSLVDFVTPDNLDKFSKQAGQIHLYYSKDDKIVPFSDFNKYKSKLPFAKTRIFENRQHFNQPEFPEIVEDIKSLE